MPSDERASSDRRGTPVEPSESDEGERSDDDENDEEDTQAATREYPTRDLPPEDYAGSAEEWSDLSDESRRIALFSLLPVADRDPSILVPNGSGNAKRNGKTPGSTPEDPTTADGLAASTCAEIRETMNDALTAREVVESYPDLHTSKIMRHAYGECNHDSVDVPATASPQIGPDECHAMRDDYRQGDPVAEVADTWSRSENTVTRHIFGRCSHDSRPRDRSPSRVGVVECERIRRTFEGNEKVSVREVACAMRLREEVVATHLFDYCRHLGNDPPRVEAADPDDADLWDGRDA
jgi:hypothetical protein